MVIFASCVSSQRSTRSSTQTLKFEDYLRKVIPEDFHFQATTDQNTGLCNRVCISFPNSKDQVIITTIEDYYSKDSKNGDKKTVFRESEERAFFISAFEAQQISKVNKVLISILDELSICLEKNEWQKCQALDSYLLRFLKSYNYLLCSATNNSVMLFSAKYDLDSIYSVSVDIERLNERINNWRINGQKKSKLLTVTKELLFQCKIWDNVLQKGMDSQILINDGLIKSMEVFIKIYLDRS